MITPFVDQTSIQALAWSLIHFLWQGTVLGLLAFAVLKHQRLRATTRYLTGVATLIAMLAAPVGTFFYLNRSTSQSERVQLSDAGAAIRPPTVSPAEAGPYACLLYTSDAADEL